MRNGKTKPTTNFLKGTLPIMTTINQLQAAKMFLLLATFAVTFYGAPQSDGASEVDPSFNVGIETDSFSVKQVVVMVAQPDDKILASGHFNTFNRQPVSGLIRLTADGLLDSTFNNNLLAPADYANKIYVQPDGKILVGGHNLNLNGSNAPLPPLFRLNADGTIDPTFTFSGGSDAVVSSAAVNADGKILVSGIFPQTESGNTVYKSLLRLNSDGTIDNSFAFGFSTTVSLVAWQADKPIIVAHDARRSQDVVLRLNSDGSVDSAFPRILSNNFSITAVKVAPDNKILVQSDQSLRRFNENGSSDAGFQTISINGGNGARRTLHIGGDGRITYAVTINSNTSAQIRRLLPNGLADPTFTSYSQVSLSAFAVQSDGEIFIGDQIFSPAGIFNQYVRLFASGAVDTAFNSGGVGFQWINPGKISAIAVQPDQKIVAAGKFDLISNVNRKNIARLNTDNTIDDSFQINTSVPGNYFSQINEFYSVRIQPNGKIIVTGSFNYFLNGSAKVNVVRLNADGSIDPTFNIGANLSDFFSASGGGKNKTATQSDGKLVVATSRGGLNDPIKIPSRFNSDGSKDLTFNPTLYNTSSAVFSYDVAVQPDQKILFSGVAINGGNRTGFIARLNSDGSLDESFQRIEESGKVVGAFNLLADGKIFIVKANGNYYTTSQSVVSRLNANGTQDATFAVGTGANGVINATLVMPNGQILLGGKFTTFNGAFRQNMVLLNADGSLAPVIYKLNEEVLSLAIDNKGRVLTGGSFTVINIGGGQNYVRSFMARLKSANRPRFDFDGDGKADLGVFTHSSGVWSILDSQTNQITDTRFGASNDKIAPADYDGDGKTDIAVFRPANGTWYLLQSTAGFTGYQWGAAADKPVAGDFDGDGKANIAVWRPSNGVWYILRSDGQYDAHHFGAASDIPVPADYDGDGKTDVAVWRPSNGTFYWLASATGNELKGIQFGASGDIPAVADYNGDGKADLVVFRPSQGIWHQCLTTAGGNYTFSAVRFGQDGDEPVAADYDGDGRTDIAVRRQGVWHLLKSNQGYTGLSFGSANAQAVAALPNQ